MARSRRRSNPVDFLIVTALQEERDAVLALLSDVEQVLLEDLPTYYRAIIPAPSQGGTYEVVVTLLNDMGNIEATQHTTRVIQALAPDYVLMVGIAGGVRGKVKLGDVVVAKQVLYYEPSKITDNGYDARSPSYLADPTLLDRVQNYNDLSWRDFIQTARPSRRGKKGTAIEQSDVVFGVIATGEKVIADTAFINQLRRLHAKILAVEMEAFGVAVAAANTRDRPRFLAIRGVSDYADRTKNDQWHRYAAESAAAFTIGFLRYGPVPPRAVRVAKQTRAATLIAIRHQSMERFPEKALVPSLPPELADYTVDEIAIDQSDLYHDRRLVDPLEAARRQGDLDHQLTTRLAAHQEANIAYYGIAHIPLLFFAGYTLSSKRAIHLFDFNRRTREWNQLQLGGEGQTLKLTGLPARVKRARGDVIVRISVSYQVTNEAIAGIVPLPIASLHLGIDHPEIDVVTSEHQVREYGRVFRSMLDSIHHRLPNTSRVHIFYSGPPPVAFHFGQQISKTIHSRIIIYNYVSKDTPPYSWGFEITTNLDDPDFVVSSTPKEA